MARNGGKARGAQPRSSGGGGSRWPFFIGGLLAGLLVALGVYLLKVLPTAMELQARAKQHELACAETAAEKEKYAKTTEKTADKAAAVDKPVTFEFYTMLPKQEVVAPLPANKTTVATPAPTPPPVPAPPGSAATTTAKPAATPSPAAVTGRYLLQAGSFRSRSEADQRRAALLLSGLSVNVQDVKLSGGETWYRVMVGPFADESAMQKARQQLAAMKVDTLPIKQK